jgi:iron complex outermembrane recepter protein
MSKASSALLAFAALVAFASVSRAQTALEEIVVTGEFRERDVNDLPASVSVVQGAAIEQRAANHLEEVLALAPNVNLAAGSSRSRFFQIRGIGERGQFVEPLNPSVGLIIDGVDLSTAASAATLFDVEQVEVFHGPQGTRYGANALAGLINVRTRAPTDEFEARLGLDVSDYSGRTLNGVVSGALGERITGRIAAQQHAGDGFLENTYLGLDDTNRRDELAVRGKLNWAPADTITVHALLGYVDIDNGYDAFSLDNDRRTRSDAPGRDAQETVFAGVDLTWDGATAFTLEASAAGLTVDSAYGYDEDWTYEGFHPFGYSSTDSYFRDRWNATAELRLLSEEAGRIFAGTTNWIVGIYALDSEVDLRREYTFLASPFTSEFTVGRTAIFGQLETELRSGTRLTAGLRYERHQSDYADSEGVAFTPNDDLVGWRISVDHPLSAAALGYVTLARGYKAGGFNTDGTLDADLRQYDPETLVNLELGVKGNFLDGRLEARVAVFYMARSDVQIASSITRVRADGSAEFIDFIGNAAEGTNSGIEGELTFAATERLEISASLGLLHSEYDSFVNAAGDDLGGREQAHAPGYQFAIGARYSFANGWYANVGAEGRDAFFFSDSHNERSQAYALVSAGVGVVRGPWNLRLWGRNLTDQDTHTRGYFFGNDPRIDYAPRLYTQLGEPRRVGFSVTRSFE